MLTDNKEDMSRKKIILDRASDDIYTHTKDNKDVDRIVKEDTQDARPVAHTIPSVRSSVDGSSRSVCDGAEDIH